MILGLFNLLLLSNIIISCTTTYKVADLRVHALEMNEVISSSMSEISKDLAKKSEIIKNLKANAADFQHYPFNQMDVDFNLLLDIKSKIQNLQLEFSEKLKEIELLEKSKERIKKNDEQFKIVTNYKDFADNLKPILERLFDDYRYTSNNFNKTTNTNQIYLIDTKALQQQMNVLKNQVDRSVKMNSIQMHKIDNQMKKDKDLSSEKSRSLHEMKGLIKQIQNEVVLVQRAAQELHKSVSAKGRVAIGPHMKSHVYIMDIKTHGLNIDTMVKRFNQLNESFRN